MHYYQHHIGDFIKATARLTDSQSMSYLRLLWMYYDSEKPLSDNPKILAFQVGTLQEDVELLLLSFFVKQEDGWHQKRCDQEISDYREFLTKKSNAGKASAERRKNSSSTSVQQMFNDCSTDVQLTTNHKPLTTNQQPLTNKRTTEMFDSFWLMYPKKTNKKKSLYYFNKHDPDEELFEKIMVGLSNYKTTDKVKNGFILDPERWLRDSRWEDEVTSIKQTSIAGAF